MNFYLSFTLYLLNSEDLFFDLWQPLCHSPEVRDSSSEAKHRFNDRPDFPYRVPCYISEIIQNVNEISCFLNMAAFKTIPWNNEYHPSQKVKSNSGIL